MDFLKGKRTYIIGAILAVAYFAQYTGLVTQDTYNSVLHLLGPLGLMSLRAAMK